MIALEEAKAMFEEMIEKKETKYTIFDVWEADFGEELDIYVMIVLDEDGVQYFPGEVFPSIRKSDGELVDFEFPCPA